MKWLVSTMIALLLVVPTRSTSGQNAAGVPPAVVESWSQLIGNWIVEGRVGTTPVKGTAKFEWAEGNYCYLGQQRWQLGEDGRSIQLALIGGWDAAENITVERGFSSGGGAASVSYQLSSDDPSVSEGSVEGVAGPNGRWSGSVRLERHGRDEFQLTTMIDGEVRHSLKYLRINAAL